MPGIVSLYEEHDARVEGGYNLIEWDSLTEPQKAFEVAHYRIRNSIDYQKHLKERRDMEAGK